MKYPLLTVLCGVLAGSAVATGVTTCTAPFGTMGVKVTESSPIASAAFGTAMDMSANGNYAVATAPMEDVGSTTGAGAAYVFKRSGSSWSQVAKLVAPTAVASQVSEAF